MQFFLLIGPFFHIHLSKLVPISSTLNPPVHLLLHTSLHLRPFIHHVDHFLVLTLMSYLPIPPIHVMLIQIHLPNIIRGLILNKRRSLLKLIIQFPIDWLAQLHIVQEYFHIRIQDSNIFLQLLLPQLLNYLSVLQYLLIINFRLRQRLFHLPLIYDSLLWFRKCRLLNYYRLSGMRPLVQIRDHSSLEVLQPYLRGFAIIMSCTRPVVIVS